MDKGYQFTDVVVLKKYPIANLFKLMFLTTISCLF